MEIRDFLSRLDGVIGSNSRWMARCPCSQNHAHGDKHRSLSVALGGNGCILVKCHKGCTVEEIAAAMGLTTADLFPDSGNYTQTQNSYSSVTSCNFYNHRKSLFYSAFSDLEYLYPKLGSIAAEYDYFDADGALLAKKLRYQLPDGSKTFRWCRPDGNGKWLRGRGDVPHRLFVAGALEDFIYIVEGEKDALTMQKLGNNTVSAADGAGSKSKWHNEYTEQLQNEGHDIKMILILQDNDDTGQAFAQETAAAVSTVCPNVKVLDISLVWPEIPEKGDISDMVDRLGEETACELLIELESETPLWTPEASNLRWKAQLASLFGPDSTRFLWKPYIPVGDYSVIMSDGGTGKTILCCGIAAAVSTGTPLPGELPIKGEGKNVLIISGEDSGEVLKKRLELSGADTNRIYIIDRSASIGITFSDEYEKFVATILAYHPALVIIDPWHNFLGKDVDISRVNALRPVLQKVSDMAKRCNCSIIMVSHVNKRAQGENANNAATGSTDFINASRSAMRLIFDETDEECRILVHTKSNYSTYGQSVRFRIEDGGLAWDGFSEITRATLEQAARQRCTPGELTQEQEQREIVNTALIQALETEADEAYPKAIRFSYKEFREKYGEQIFGIYQPKRALDAVKNQLGEDGYFLHTGSVKYQGKPVRGFTVQKMEIKT